MVEILQTVLDALRVTQFASHYSNSLDQFLYAIFFPMILLIIILYLLMGRVFSGHKGLELLLGVSFFIFVIVYPPNAQTSLYGALAPIGSIWYLVIVVLGFFWILLGRMHPRAGGSHDTGGARGLSVAGETYKKIRGKEFPDIGVQTHVMERIAAIDAAIAQLEKARKEAGSTDEKKTFAEEISHLIKEKAELQRSIKL